MLKKLSALFSGGAPATEARGVDEVQLATCVVLVEAACADDNFTDTERDHILGVMGDRFALSREDAQELLDLATAAREDSSDLYRFTRTINDAFSVVEKIQIVEEVWRIFYSDQELDGHEDHLARKLQHLLNLNHPTMIEAKMRVLGELKSSDSD